MGEQWYHKKNGRYIPLNDPSCYDGLTEGSWLVTVRPGSTSTRQAITPKFIALEAALEYLEEGLTKAIAEESEIRPSPVRMSDKEIKAWDQFRRAMGTKDMPRYFAYYPSYSQIARAGCEYVKKIMIENNFNIKKIKKAVKKIELKNENKSNSMIYLKIGKI